MRILNIMLGRGKGGIEQAALDYAEALTLGGHEVINVFDPAGWAFEFSCVSPSLNALRTAQPQTLNALRTAQPQKAETPDGARAPNAQSGALASQTVENGDEAREYPEAFSHAQPVEHIAEANRREQVRTLKNYGAWDIFAAAKLRSIAQEHHCDAIICHGNRAISLALRACKGSVPVIGVAHNYKTKRFAKLDAAFAITEDLCARLRDHGLAEETVFAMPNMVRTPEILPKRSEFRTPPIIGSMGRFVAKKGFEVYIEALAVLQQRGVAFEAVLGGDGEEEDALKARAAEHTLPLTFSGWVENKHTFFDALDIFVLPSHHEPFGIVLIEAMAEALPVVSTASEGPSEILAGGAQGLLVSLNDAEAMADALQMLIENQATARELGEHAYRHCTTHYSLPAMAERLTHALDEIVTTHM